MNDEILLENLSITFPNSAMDHEEGVHLDSSVEDLCWRIFEKDNLETELWDKNHFNQSSVEREEYLKHLNTLWDAHLIMCTHYRNWLYDMS